MSVLVLNPFSFFPSYPPASTAYVTSLLRTAGIEVHHVDANLLIWSQLLTPEFLASREYHPAHFEGAPCPYCPPTTARKFAELKRFVAANIGQALGILRDGEAFYDVRKFNWACLIVYQAQLVIYYDFGAFLTSHIVHWPQVGFEVNSLATMRVLSADRRRNPMIHAIEAAVLPALQGLAPELIVLDIVWPWDVVAALSLMNALRKRFPKAHLNYPGQGFDEFSFSRLQARVEAQPELLLGFDSVFMYRNDAGVVELATRRLRGDTSLGEIPNLAYVDEAGQVQMATPFQRLPYMGTFVPDYTDLPLEQYFAPRRVFVDRLSLRCYWAQCHYCSINHHLVPAQQIAALDDVMRRLEAYRDLYDCRHVWFMDEACPPGHALAFAQKLREKGMQLTWSLRTRIDKEYTKEALRQLYDSGLRELWVGLESVDPDVLRIMNKTSEPESYADVAADLLQACSEIGIGIHACLLMGVPSETDRQRESLIEFFERNQQWLDRMPFFVTFNAFGLTYGSRMYREPERFGITSIDEGADCFNMMRIPYTTRWGDEVQAETTKKTLGTTMERLLDLFVRNKSLTLSWFSAADSPYELLLKEHCAATGGKNSYRARPSFAERVGAAVYRGLDGLPFVANPCREYLRRQLVGVQQGGGSIEQQRP